MHATEQFPAKPVSLLKKLFVVGMGLGAGIVLMLGVVFAGFIWYTSRPKAWKTEVLKATFAEPSYRWNNDFKLANVLLDYKVENTSNEDYTLSGSSTLMVSRKDSLEQGASYGFEDSCFIPSKQTVKCRIVSPMWFDTSAEMNGFVIFDSANRYKIVFPKPNHPTPKEREENSEINLIPHVSGSKK